MRTQQHLCHWLRVQDCDAGESSLKQVVNLASLLSIVCGHCSALAYALCLLFVSNRSTFTPELFCLLCVAVHWKSFAWCLVLGSQAGWD